MNSRAIIIYCGLLMTASAVAIDVILPAFGLMATSFDEPYSTIQLVVPVFIFAAGIGQLFWGSLSDKFGRKPILKIGLIGFVIGSILCLLAPNIELMLAGRAIQGVSVASGSVMSRAVLRDLFSGTELARNMAFATMIFALGPIVGPIIGAGVLAITTWRYILFVVLIFGIALLIVALFYFEETILEKKQSATKLSQIKSNIAAVLGNSQSRFFILVSGSIGAVIIFLLISLPRVFLETFNIEGATFALLFSIHGLGIIAGQFVNRWLISTYGVRRALVTGASVLALSGLLVVGVNAANLMSASAMVTIITFLATSHLIVVSNATSLTLDPHGSIAGFVSSFFGFVSQTSSAVIGTVLAILIGGNVMFFGYALLGLTLFNLCAIKIWAAGNQKTSI